MSMERQAPTIEDPNVLISEGLLKEWDTDEAWKIHSAASDKKLQDIVYLLPLNKHIETKELVIDGLMGMIENEHGLIPENISHVLGLSERLRSERLADGEE